MMKGKVMNESEKDRLVIDFLTGIGEDNGSLLMMKTLLPHLTKKSELYASRNLHPYEVMFGMGGLSIEVLEKIYADILAVGCVVNFLASVGISRSRSYAIYNDELKKADDTTRPYDVFRSVVSIASKIRRRGKPSRSFTFKAYHGNLMMTMLRPKLAGRMMPVDGEIGVKYEFEVGRDKVVIDRTNFPGLTPSQLMLTCGIWSIVEGSDRFLVRVNEDNGLKNCDARVRFRLRDLLMTMTGREWKDAGDAVRNGMMDEMKGLMSILNKSGGYIRIGKEEYPLVDFFVRNAGAGLDLDNLTGNEIIEIEDPYGRRYVQSCRNVIDVPDGLIGKCRCEDFREVCGRLYIIYRVLVSRHLDSKSMDKKAFERDFGYSYRLMRTTMKALKDAGVVDEYSFSRSAVAWTLSPWGNETNNNQKKEQENE